MCSTANSPTWSVVPCSKASVMGLDALKASREIKHPNVNARMPTIFFILGMTVVLAAADVNIKSFQIDPLPRQENAMNQPIQE
jgi:hypothetical protein